MSLSMDSKISELLANEQVKQGLEQVLPGVLAHPHLGYAMDMTLRNVIPMMPTMFTSEVVEKIESMLQNIAE